MIYVEEVPILTRSVSIFLRHTISLKYRLDDILLVIIGLVITQQVDTRPMEYSLIQTCRSSSDDQTILFDLFLIVMVVHSFFSLLLLPISSSMFL
jgi:hypothetical protein